MHFKTKPYLLHSFGLSSRAYSGHGQTYINSWTNTLVEQLSLQEDLKYIDSIVVWLQ